MNDHDKDRRPSASGRIPEDAPGGPELEPRPADWDDAAMDRFWLGVYSRLERGLAWTLVSASAAVLLGYWAYVFATEFMADGRFPWIVRRCTQLLRPLGLTRRYRVCSARYFPGSRSAFALAAVIVFMRLTCRVHLMGSQSGFELANSNSAPDWSHEFGRNPSNSTGTAKRL